MSAMNTASAIAYYRAGTAEQIYWPMSTVSWAYPRDDSGKLSQDNGHDYPQIGLFDREVARESILDYMAAAGVSEGDSQLKITFTIAGSNLQEHPAYVTFRDAAALLNELGWDVEVVPDTQALTKLSTGSLEVWAAAWGSSIDPDLYQVYHKNSTATSTLAWGYPSIKNSSTRTQEQKILDELSELIDDARSTTDKDERTALYEEAMSKVLDLAIELPVYQRSTVYVYNSKIIKESSLPSASEMNPYTSPLDKIWEIEFAD
jgi:peptide/nickel transport system substrate-binding protein